MLLLFIKSFSCHSQISCFLPWPLSPCTSEMLHIIPLKFACYFSEQLGQSLAVSRACYLLAPRCLTFLRCVPDGFVPHRACASFFPLIILCISLLFGIVLHLIYFWSIYCWGDMHNEYPWAFIKFSFEQFLFPLSVLNVLCFWSLAHINLRVCQHLLRKKIYTSLCKDILFFSKTSWKSLVKNNILLVTFRISLFVPFCVKELFQESIAVLKPSKS